MSTAKHLALTVALVCFAAGPAAAQTIRGTITGTVMDSTGGVVPGVTVTVMNKSTGISASALTTKEGSFTVRRTG